MRAQERTRSMSNLTGSAEPVKPAILDKIPSSFVSRYTAAALKRTDAPAEAHILMAFGILSALAGPRPRIPIAASIRGSRLTLWIMFIVNSTIGRKTTVIEFAKDIIAAVLGNEAIVEWEGSPQGFIQRFQERDGQPTVFVRDEYSGLLWQMNRGGHMAGLEQTFIRAYDGHPLENIRTRKREKMTGESRRDTDRVENPCLVKLTGTTWDFFTQKATIDNVLSGFLTRFIFVTGAAMPQALKRTNAGMEREHTELIQLAHAFHLKARSIDRVDLRDDVLDLHWQLQQTWDARARESQRPDAVGPFVQRLADSILKIAALLAIDETTTGEPPCITLDHFDVAQTLGERWLVDSLRLIETLGATDFQRNTDAVMTTVIQHPAGIKLSDLYSRHRRLRERDFREILAALGMQERITQVQVKAQGKGRRATIVYPVLRAS